MAQRYMGHTLIVSALPDAITISLQTQQTQIEARVPAHLLDNKWHTIQFLHQLGDLNLVIDKRSVVVANATYNQQLLSDIVIKNEAAVLILGKMFSGCMLHGPGLVFNTSAMHAQGVLFGSCPLATGPCSDHDVLIREPVDHCKNVPCMQHGQCISRPDSYQCHCTSRYSGKNCEVDTGNPCLTYPCNHGGSCHELQDGNFKCVCAAGYTGKFCDTELSIHPLCEKNPCHNNGTCRLLPQGKSFECDCLEGFTGTRCEIDWNDCESSPCQNGRCVDEVGGFSCVCEETGYSGTLCQNNINECILHNPCQNNGNCFDNYGSYTCECVTGFGGQNCEVIINECQSLPCQSGGTCIDHKGSYECICPSGFGGQYCEIGPQCPQCPNDSECLGGKCVCKAGTTGTLI